MFTRIHVYTCIHVQILYFFINFLDFFIIMQYNIIVRLYNIVFYYNINLMKVYLHFKITLSFYLLITINNSRYYVNFF